MRSKACKGEVPLFALQDIPIPTLKEIFEAMKGNSLVESLSIAATRSNDPVAYVSTSICTTANKYYLLLLRRSL